VPFHCFQYVTVAMLRWNEQKAEQEEGKEKKAINSKFSKMLRRGALKWNNKMWYKTF